jgi:hypothetical protein
VLVVGPEDTGVWKRARQASKGGVRALGTKADVAEYYASADLYLEGFPIGSLTALLEACCLGVNFVNAPATLLLSPLHSGDDISLTRFRLPFLDQRQYVETIRTFLSDKAKSTSRAEMMSAAVCSDHCGHGWREHLTRLENRCPNEHAVQRLFEVREQVTQEDLVWASFQGRVLRCSPLSFGVAAYGRFIPQAERKRCLLKIAGTDGLLVAAKRVAQFAPGPIKWTARRVWSMFQHKRNR